VSFLRIEDLHLNLGEFRLDGIDLELEKGDYLCIIGPTGAGKTILLESVIGFWAPDRGRIFLDGTEITHARPERRHIGIVYQSYALLPHFTVFQNIAYGLKKRQKSGIESAVRQMAESLNIDHLLQRKPATLSGGEQQRVALARALAVKPALLLMDEPFSALDPRTRHRARELMRKAVQGQETTVIHITHDLDDVWTLADKAAVFHDGRCRQFGPADEVLDRPADPFVADFVGTNLLEGAVLERNGDRSLVGVNGFAIYSRDGAEVGKSVQLAIRPENIRIIRTPPADSDCLAVTIESVAREAKACVLQVRASETCLSVVAAHQTVQRLDLHPGDQVYARIEKENVCIVGSGEITQLSGFMLPRKG